MPEHDEWEAFRTLLKTLLQDPAIRTRIEQGTDIAPRTFSRWVSGQTGVPDSKRLISLINAIPDQRSALLTAIRKAIPDFQVPLINPITSLTEHLPISFVHQLLETNANTPYPLRFTTLVQMIWLQLQSVLDPDRLGIRLSIALCSFPATPGGPIRSLREIVKLTTHQSLQLSPSDEIFLGLESLCGHCVGTCKVSVVQDVDREEYLPVRRSEGECSAVAYPIQRGGQIAGSFLVSSPVTDWFTEQILHLLQTYTYLLSLAFDSDQFYPLERIFLRPMPSEAQQRHHIVTFPQRVFKSLQEDASLLRRQAEQRAWQEIEEALLNEPIL